ncbi:MAG: SRPBCC family protein [Pseudomonadales bacterium]
MFEVVVQHEVSVNVAIVWNLLSNFGEIHWVPGMSDVEYQVEGSGVGMRRILPTPEVSCVEQLDAIDHEQRTMRYSIVSGSPMPVKDLVVSAAVTEIGSNCCRIQWSCTAGAAGVSEDEAKSAVEGFYSMLAGWVEDEVTRISRQ